MRMSMARSVMRLGPVHVLVLVASPSLRGAVVEWLRRNKRVRIVRAAASAADVDPRSVEVDLVVSSGLEGTRELRAIGKAFARRAGLVALSLGTTELPVGWVGVGPGASHRHVLDQAMPHPERSVAATWTVISAVVVALAALLVSTVWVPASGVSFQRAALAYAARFPDAGTWWHIYGAGGPYLASPAWPVLKLVALVGGGPELFALQAGVIGALYGVAFVLLAARAGARRAAPAIALAAMLPPALWVWPRGGDLSSLAGLAGVVFVLAGTRLVRYRLATTAFAVAVGATGGLTWVLAAAVVGIVAGMRSRQGRAGSLGAILGVLLSAAITVPPFLSRGIAAVEPPLARPFAISDLVPVLASGALIALVLAGRRVRVAVLCVAVFAAANLLALAVPTTDLAVPRIPSTGPFGRLAVHPLEALAFATRFPDLPTTGDDVSGPFMLGSEPKEVTNTTLEWLGVDRAVLPDRSAAVTFNERDWSVLDRDRLLLGAPRVRPILTGGATPTVLVVADLGDAQALGDGLARLGTTSDVLIPVRADRSLDELDADTLQQFTLLAVYGQPWKDRAKAEKVLRSFLDRSGFLFMDAAGRAGPQPLLPEAKTVRDGPDETSRAGEGDERKLVDGDRGYDGRIVGMDKFVFAGDASWERAALLAGDRRLVQFGRAHVEGSQDIFAHVVWSGVDLPRRATRGDTHALAQLKGAFEWLLGSTQVPPQTAYSRVSEPGEVADSEDARVTFFGPGHWRIELKVESTGILFKERFHEQWHASQVNLMPLTQAEVKTSVPLMRTTHGYIYVPLPPNARTIDLSFERHPFEQPVRGVSAVALFLTLGITFLQRRRR